ncbi:MAG: hypothetical protein ACT4NL_15135 [Pseudomarimonas sp.]
MAFDLFVTASALPENLAANLQAALLREGFTLPVQVFGEGDGHRIEVGAWDEDQEPAEGLRVWASAIDDDPINESALTGAVADRREIVRRHQAATRELHFSGQHVVGPRGVKLMYITAALLAGLLPNGLYLDPSESGWHLPDAALVQARKDARQYEASMAPKAAPPSAPRRGNDGLLGWIILAGVLLWGAWKLKQAGYW